MAILKIRDPETGLFQEVIVIKGETGPAGGDLTMASQLPIVDAGAYFAATDVEAALQEIGSTLGSLSAAAVDISIADAGAYFAATNVETALQEVATTKAPIASPTFTGTVTLPSTTSIGNLTSTEIGYLDGITSSVQTQINTKAPIAAPTFTGTVTVATRIDFEAAASIVYNSTTKSIDFIFA